MAIVKFGVIVTAARGTIAGTIFTANKAGPYARGWSRGPNPRSPLQSTHRAITANMTQRWRDIDQGDRDDWDVWAALPAQEKFNSLGESYYASGFNWFVAINVRLTLAGRSPRVPPPVLARPPAPTITAVRFKATGDLLFSRVQFPWNEFVGYDCILFAALSSSIGVLTKTTGWRSMLAGAPELPNFHNFQTELQSSFGTVQLLQRGFIHMHRQSTDGLRSPVTSAYADVD